MAAEDGQLNPRVSDTASDNESLPAIQRAPAAAYDEPSLAEFLTQEPYCFSFYAALRVLAQIRSKDRGPNQEPRSAIEQIRFRAHQAFSFPASELWDVKTRAANESADKQLIAEMTVTFLGLTGSM